SLSNKEVEFFSSIAQEKILSMIREDLTLFRVKFDKWYSEKELHKNGEVSKVIGFLKQKGAVYEENGALWLNSTKYGDEKDRVVIRKNGEPTYLASDIAYHKDKYERGYDLIINLWGADHHGYIARMKSVIEAMGYDTEKFKVILIQMVNLLREGKPVAMGKREGEFITLREVLEEVGVDAARYFFLERKSDAHLNFDLTLAKEQSNNNPVYYIQYAYARICSIFRKAKEKGVDTAKLKEANLTKLSNKKEIEILKKIDAFEEIIKLIATTFEPHHLTFYLKELVGMFHAYYYENPILSDDKELSIARLQFIKAIQQVIKNGLMLLNIEAPERM
ncbi:MAG: arginine--tRNA ligase, partial [Candidatus Schekmanbacteria bacterium]